jgi:hypothetical protein
MDRNGYHIVAASQSGSTITWAREGITLDEMIDQLERAVRTLRQMALGDLAYAPPAHEPRFGAVCVL